MTQPADQRIYDAVYRASVWSKAGVGAARLMTALLGRILALFSAKSVENDSARDDASAHRLQARESSTEATSLQCQHPAHSGVLSRF